MFICADSNIIAAHTIESRRRAMRILLHVVFSLMLLASCANDLVEEQVDVEGDGAVVTCGEGDGLNPCIDPNGETEKQAEDPNYIKPDTTSEMEKSSAEIRAETPKELEKTIEGMENND
jgi:hypothetical protein